MSFAQPLLLFGLLGAAVPILIHLIHRRRPRRQPFPAMQLLLRSVERAERRWRVRRILLLLLRVLLLAALALAAARPFLGSSPTRVARRLGPERLAIVVDASLSMRARPGGRTTFERAVATARDLVGQLGPEDQALIVWTGRPPRLSFDRPTADAGRLLAALDDGRPGWTPGSIAEAVSVGVQALGRGEGPSRPLRAGDEPEAGPAPAARVVVLSDLAGNAVDGAAELAMPDGAVATVEIVDVLTDVSASQRSNHGIVAVSVDAVPGEAPLTLDFEARVQSFASETGAPRPLAVRLREAERLLEESLVEVTPGASAQKVLRHTFEEAGRRPCVLELEPDALIEDGLYYVYAEAREPLRMLLVDGDPSGVAKKDEVFYLERALAAGASDQPPPRVVSGDDLAGTDLGTYDVLVLAGVPSLSPGEGDRVASFVESGGGLLLTAAEGMDVDSLNAALERVLPRRLRGLRQLEGQAASFESPALDHPILRVFGGEALGGLMSTATRGMLLLDPGGERPMTTLLGFDAGVPALVVSEVGKGRVGILATSVDRDLTDLPIRPAFVPLVRQLVLWLGDALSEPDRRRTLVGEPRELVVPPGATRLEVRTPEARTTSYGLADFARGKVTFLGTVRPGAYEVLAAFGDELRPVLAESFVVNVDPAESDLRPIDSATARAILEGEVPVTGAGPGVVALATGRALSSELLVRTLLGLMGLAFLLESALTALRAGR